MGWLTGFTCQQATRKLRHLCVTFTRQASGSRGVWWNAGTRYRTTIPNCQGNQPEGTRAASLQQAGITVAEQEFTRRLRVGGAACLRKSIRNHPTSVWQPTALQEQWPVRRQGPWRGLRSACRTCRQTARTDPGRLRNGRGVPEHRRVAGRRWRARGRRRRGSE